MYRQSVTSGLLSLIQIGLVMLSGCSRAATVDTSDLFTEKTWLRVQAKYHNNPRARELFLAEQLARALSIRHCGSTAGKTLPSHEMEGLRELFQLMKGDAIIAQMELDSSTLTLTKRHDGFFDLTIMYGGRVIQYTTEHFTWSS